ncbi:MAG: hypothetical protein WCG29_05245 [Desulfomonile sp.]|jgi:hypothetical protein|nr:hypothetical protein [Deltaproteobacteria bacterium]
MPNTEVSSTEDVNAPHRLVREDPRYDEIKKIIEEFPPEKMGLLKSYIQKWLGNQ